MRVICYQRLMLRNMLILPFVCVWMGLLSAGLVVAQEEVSAQGQGDTSGKVQEVQEPEKGHRPYSITVGVRQGYDDNIYTSHTDTKGSWTSGVQPSFLLNYPVDNMLFSLRYAFDALYYWDRPGDQWQMSHELTGRFNHAISERLNIDTRERFRYSQDPQIYDSASVLQQNGDYINNTASTEVSYQWTPKLSTVTSYTNDLYRYNDQTLKETNDNVSHLLSHDFRYLLDPTVTAVVGGSFNRVDYDYADRSWQTYTGYTGADWTISPLASVGGRIGGQAMDPQNGGNMSASPYGSANFNWTLGARSSLALNYSHSISQTDIVDAYAQISDTFNATFTYQWTPRFSTSLQGMYRLGYYGDTVTLPGSGNGYNEDVLGLTLSAGYKLNDYLSLNASYSFTNVSNSEDVDREYTRNQINFGLTATY
jgi:hypothetical protein